MQKHWVNADREGSSAAIVHVTEDLALVGATIEAFGTSTEVPLETLDHIPAFEEHLRARDDIRLDTNVSDGTPSDRWTTYNFEVADHHTYIANGMRVHNTSTHGTLFEIGGVRHFFDDRTGVIVNYDEWLADRGVPGEFVPAGYDQVPGTHAGVPKFVILDDNGTIIGHATTFADLDGDGINEQITNNHNSEHLQRAREILGIDPPPADRRNDDEGKSSKPVIIDLDGDGVEINVSGQVNFDWDDDGFLERGAWVGADDGFLVVDLDADGSFGAGDGQIDQTRELVLSEWGSEGMTDLEALAHAKDANGNRIFDTNGDGFLTAADASWSSFRIWQDANQNGVVDTGELQTLDALGFTEINLVYDDGTEYYYNHNDVTIFGNTLLGTASFTRNGVVTEGGVGDVALAYIASGYRQVNTATGYSIEFETGEALHYAVLDGAGAADVQLWADGFDGATGDVRANNLNGQGHIRSLQISGGDGNDTITGGANDDWISGDVGADHLLGLAGDDVIFADADDFLTGHVSGGDGYDAIIVADTIGATIDVALVEAEVVTGGSGADNITATMALDGIRIGGNDGSDTITGGAFEDLLSGDDGDDVLSGAAGEDSIFGGVGADSLEGGSQSDRLSGDEGADTVVGGAGDDTLEGGAQADHLNGGLGSDRLLGGAGNDVILDGDGHHDDFIDAGEGHDTVTTAGGDDVAIGGEGNDVFFNGAGDDFYYGDEGDDIFYAGLSHGYDVYFGGTGFDVLHLDGVAAGYEIRWQQGTNDILLHSLDGNIVIDTRGVEAFQFSDGYQIGHVAAYGADQAAEYYVGRTKAYNSPYSNNADHPQHSYYSVSTSHDWLVAAPNVSQVVDTRSGQDSVSGSNLSDALFGGSGADTIAGGDGNDSLTGNSGSDSIDGGSGADIILGVSGRDVINGDEGADTIHGGSGGDVLDGGVGHDVLHGEDGDDQILGGAGNDIITGGSGADTVDGGEGSDNIDTGSGADQVAGGAGNDTIDAGSGVDQIYGQGGNDSIDGGRGNDEIYGGSGNDSVHGGRGTDVLSGGHGSDTLHGNEDDDLLFADLPVAELPPLNHNLPDMSSAASNALAMMYLASQPSLISLVNTGQTIPQMASTAQLHFNQRQALGWTGASMEITFDPYAFLASQPSLLAHIPDLNNEAQLIETVTYHFVVRTLVNPTANWLNIDFDANQYYANYGEVQEQVAPDAFEAAKHYVLHGRAAGYVYDQPVADTSDELYGGAGHDTLVSGEAADIIDGGSGVLDAVSYELSDAGITVDLQTGTGTSGYAAGDTLFNIEGVIGSDFDDAITGDGGSNFVEGGAGNDLISGMAGNDFLYGADGNDTLKGGDGRDTLEGGEGVDYLLGGNSSDVMTGGGDADLFAFIFGATSDTGNVIADFEDSVDQLEIQGVTFVDLTLTNTADGALISWSTGDVVLTGVDVSLIGMDDFLFT